MGSREPESQRFPFGDWFIVDHGLDISYCLNDRSMRFSKTPPSDSLVLARAVKSHCDCLRKINLLDNRPSNRQDLLRTIPER
jgi:hypothetical protein